MKQRRTTLLHSSGIFLESLADRRGSLSEMNRLVLYTRAIFERLSLLLKGRALQLSVTQRSRAAGWDSSSVGFSGVLRSSSIGVYVVSPVRLSALALLESRPRNLK